MQRNNKAVIAVIAVLILGAAGAYFFLTQNAEPPAPPPAQQAVVPPPVQPAPAPVAKPEPVPTPAPTAPVIRYPIGAAPTTTPLPELEQSDAPFRKALSGLLSKKWLAFLISDGMIHHIVATVDSLPRKKIPVGIVPLKPVPGAFMATGKGDALAIGSRNFARYAPYARLAQAVDSTKLVAVYVQFYPLFQFAYEELGNSKAYFNDRLVEALDDLLAAPDISGPIKLTRPWLRYDFADPDLEARSAGQKIIIRMGRDNAAQVKAKLREIRQQVTRGAGSAATP